MKTQQTEDVMNSKKENKEAKIIKQINAILEYLNYNSTPINQLSLWYKSVLRKCYISKHSWNGLNSTEEIIVDFASASNVLKELQTLQVIQEVTEQA